MLILAKVTIITMACLQGRWVARSMDRAQQTNKYGSVGIMEKNMGLYKVYRGYIDCFLRGIRHGAAVDKVPQPLEKCLHPVCTAVRLITVNTSNLTRG